MLPLAILEAGLVIAWSSGFIGARLAADTTSVFLVLFWRFVVVSLILVPWLLRQMRRGLPARSLILQSVLGAFAMFGYLALGVKAIELGVPVGTAALISALQPIVTAALAGPVLQERVNRSQRIGLGLGLAGVSLAVGGSLGGASLWAYSLSGASTLSLVIATIIAKALPDNTPLLPSLAMQSIVSAVLFAPLTLLNGGIFPSLGPRFIGAVAWFILFSTIGGYGLYWLCLGRSTATRVGSLIYLTPPVTMIWGWLMFSEPITMSAIIGFVVCIVGVLLMRPVSGQR
ncbi:DMT family transporter [Rhizobium rhizogenes]|uniref:EamA-like transporter family protein n=1 Tax=Rhizobium rhizogenes TaxID=359 RepID=A0A7S5DR56_RHIRH|nr:DMT family transporter [Rhizobium rhizogenes]QCL10523.1 eamA-like transporter family protein [Rhizobium rhizogenes]